MASSAPARTLDVADFLGGLRISPFHRWLIFISSLVMFFDGMDFSLVSVTLPYIRDDLQLSNAMMGVISSATFLGQMIGALAGSYVADLFGRRPVILVSTVLSAVLTFATGLAGDAETLIVLRLLGGLAIGALLAPAQAFNVEAMPNHFRSTSVTIIMLGFSVGGSAAALTSNLIAPTYGWEGVFFFCGAMTMLLAIVVQFALPESARWMVAKGKPVGEIMPLLRRFAPERDLSGYAAVTLSDERTVAGAAPGRRSLARSFAQFAETMRELFKGSLAWITPIIWATYFCSSFAMYIKASFGLLFLEKLEIPVTTANYIISAGGIAGAVGAVLLLAFTERRGPAWLAIAPLLGVPLALLIGSGLVLGGPLFVPVIVLGSIAVGVAHASVISILAIYYPSSVRSTGGGLASFVAKFAAVAAPNVAANLFLADKAAVLDGYSFVGLCLAGVFIGLVALTVFARRLRAEREAQTVVIADPEPGIA